MGEGYGPMIVAKSGVTVRTGKELNDCSPWSQNQRLPWLAFGVGGCYR